MSSMLIMSIIPIDIVARMLYKSTMETAAYMLTRPALAICFWLSLAVPGWTQSGNVIRVGAFPNITHAQAMVGKANGWFDKAMGTPGRPPSKRYSPAPSI